MTDFRGQNASRGLQPLLLSTALTAPPPALQADRLPRQQRQQRRSRRPRAGAGRCRCFVLPPTLAEIVVTGARHSQSGSGDPRSVTVLSTAEIARTGEGNIAGALGRVTGLSSSAAALSMSAGWATAIRWRCSTARRCPAPSRCAGWCRSIFSRPTWSPRAGPEKLFGQFSRRIRWRRDQSHHHSGARGAVLRRSAPAIQR